MKLNVFAFALAFGIWWGVGLFLTTWWLILVGNTGGVSIIERVYLGYQVTPVGSIVGLIEGFFCGLVFGGILAWLYNVLDGRLGTTREAANQASS